MQAKEINFTYKQDLIEENIAEMAMTVGSLIAEGYFPKQALELSSSEIAQAVIQWAKEFEDRFEGPHIDYSQISEIGNPLGYIDAIDNFTDLKLKEQAWVTSEYTQQPARFWNRLKSPEAKDETPS